MNPILQTLIRSILKTLGGYFIAKGLLDQDNAETISAGLAALIGVVWGVMHRAPAQSQPVKVTTSASALLILALMPALMGMGCAYVKAYDDQRQAGFKTVMPAWPWQDTTAVLDRMNVSSKSNSFTASVRGLSESDTISTNVADIAGKITGAAVSAIVGGVKK